MSARVRWIVVGVVVLLVVGLVALYWLNETRGAIVTESDGRRTWTIPSGETVKLSADEVRAEDRYVCDDIGHRPLDAPSPGHLIATEGVKGVIQVETAEDGGVTVTCEKGVALP